jgi:hypothetical protein
MKLTIASFIPKLSEQTKLKWKENIEIHKGPTQNPSHQALIYKQNLN